MKENVIHPSFCELQRNVKVTNQENVSGKLNANATELKVELALNAKGTESKVKLAFSEFT